MEITPGKVALVVLPLALLGAGVAQGKASYQASARMHDLREAVRTIGHGPGLDLPTDDAIRAQVEALAAERGVTLDGLSVVSHEEDGIGNAARLAPQLGQVLRGRIRVYEVRATTHTKAWLLTASAPLETSVRLRSSLELAAPPRPMLPSGIRPEELGRELERGLR
jgi:hypothetical protein